MEENIRFFVDAERGNYSYTIKPIGIESVLLDIEQMDPAILYSRLYRCNEFDCDNKQLFGLMLPMLVQEQDTDDGIKFMRV